MAKPQTNVEFVTNMMEFSKYGALSQIFILEAIRNWSELVAKGDPAKLDSPMISGQAWVGVAKEIQQKIQDRK
jgi:hypothetical protein